jgi:hypothetical protein
VQFDLLTEIQDQQHLLGVGGNVVAAAAVDRVGALFCVLLLQFSKASKNLINISEWKFE